MLTTVSVLRSKFFFLPVFFFSSSSSFPRNGEQTMKGALMTLWNYRWKVRNAKWGFYNRLAAIYTFWTFNQISLRFVFGSTVWEGKRMVRRKAIRFIFTHSHVTQMPWIYTALVAAIKQWHCIASQNRIRFESNGKRAKKPQSQANTSIKYSAQ